MSKHHAVIALIPAFNEQEKIGRVLERIPPGCVNSVVVVDDGSTDRTAEVAREHGATVLSMGRVCGVGAALRTGLAYVRTRGYDIVVILAGNNKDEPREIPSLLAPIRNEDCDLVVGSRFLSDGRYGGDMPAYRKIATRVHPLLMSLFVGKRVTESTNGFRAFKLSMLDDPRLNLSQPWLDGYGLEVYLLFKAIKLGYRHVEVPCTKLYPSRRVGYTKMKPVVGWWDILKPIYLLGLKLRA